MIITRKQTSVVVIVSIALFLNYYFALALGSKFDKATSIVIYPLIRVMNVCANPFRNVISWWKTTAMLEEQVSGLTREIEELRAENISLTGQVAYFEDIKEVTSFKDRYADRGVVGQIIMKHFSNACHYMLVDAGSYKNITNDMVAVYQNMIIGRVSEVFPFYSKIVLITDRLCRVPARCAGTGTAGVHEGENKLGQTQLNFVSHLDEVKVDDIVLSSGQGLIFPAGFGLGRVQEIAVDDFGLNLHVKVNPLVDFENLKAVKLINKGTEEKK